EKLGGHNANDCEGRSVERNILAHDLRIAVQSLLPKAIADDCRRLCSGRVIFVGEHTPFDRVDAHNCKVVSGNEVTRRALDGLSRLSLCQPNAHPAFAAAECAKLLK